MRRTIRGMIGSMSRFINVIKGTALQAALVGTVKVLVSFDIVDWSADQVADVGLLVGLYLILVRLVFEKELAELDAAQSRADVVEAPGG